MFDPNLHLTEDELTKLRTPMELARWIEDKRCSFADCPEAKQWVLLSKGLFKKFNEELWPLSLFATNLYKERPDIQCVPNLDNRDFDATIFNHSISPPSELKVEITSAINGYEWHLRMKYFLEHGSVFAWGKVSASGNERVGHEIEVENECIACSVTLEQTFSLILSAVKKKSFIPDKPPKYGQGHVLVVAFDDCWWFKPEQKIANLKDFMEKNVLTLPLNFAALYLVGLSKATFVPFNC